MNIHHMLQGRINTHLNANGRAQAEKAGAFLQEAGIRPDVVLTSPLDRAKETGEIATGIGREHFIEEPLLIEMSFGDYEGVDAEHEHPAFYHDFFDRPDQVVMPEGAETFPEILLRAGKFLDRLTAEYPITDPRTVLCVAHGAILHAVLADINHTPLRDYWKIPIDNCSVWKLGYGPDAPEGRSMQEVFEGWSWRKYRKDLQET